MVVCNVCSENKTIDEMRPGLRYVCKECWNAMVITFDGEVVDKDIIY